MRVTHEHLYWPEACFVTLTYAPEHLPKDGSIDKEELQRFFKRLRKNLDGRKIRYYATGEYGDRTYRPHYHAIIMGISLAEHHIGQKGHCLKGPINDAWEKGFVNLGTVNAKSIRYVANYINKVYHDPDLAERMYRGKTQPFKILSNGMGKEWVKDNLGFLMENACIRIKGNEVSLPLYYAREIERLEELMGLEPMIMEELKLRGLSKASEQFYDMASNGIAPALMEEEIYRRRIRKESHVKNRAKKTRKSHL